MNYRPLGATGLRLSEIGFGAWGIGGATGGDVAYGPTDDHASRTALRAALDAGINFFDTSDLYGFGHSEELIGEVFQNDRAKVIIASKGGFLDAQRQDFSPKHLREALDNSLRRLRSDYVDLYQLHSPPVSVLKEQPEILAMLAEWKAAGKIRAWGFSARSPEEARVAVEEFAAPCVQINFNLTDQRAAENGLFQLCQQRGAGVIGRTPLCFGFLTGRYSTAAGFDARDHRSKWSPEQIQRWQQANDAFQFLFDENPKDTPAQIALRFCLSHASLSTVIPGMLLDEHVRENSAASRLGPLSPAQLERAARAYSATEFFVRKRAA